MKQVKVTTTLEGFEDWHVDIGVPLATTVAKFKSLLAAPPHSLAVTPALRILNGLNAAALTPMKDYERVKEELVLLNFRPPNGEARVGSTTLGIAEILGVQSGPWMVQVTVKTTFDGWEDWSLQLSVPKSTTVRALKDILRRPPHSLGFDERAQKVLMRLAGKYASNLGTMRDDERVEPEVILLNFVPGSEAQDIPAPSKMVETDLRGLAMRNFELVKARHAKECPLDRRAYSWCRTASWAEQAFRTIDDVSQQHLRAADGPFVIWILDATEEVEGNLVEHGFFDDIGFFEGRPVECYIMGQNLRNYAAFPGAGPLTETYRSLSGQRSDTKHGVHLRKFSYDDGDALASAKKPDLVMLFCTDFPNTIADGRPHVQLPKHVLEAARGGVSRPRAAFTTNFKFWEASIKNLTDAMGDRLVFPPIRSPFSSQAGDKTAEFDDNGWVVGLQNLEALEEVLQMDLRAPLAESRNPEEKLSAIFWGIIDLKYDPRLPILERVKVLETGDGRSSKFSNHGAEIPRRFRAKHRLEDFACPRFTVVSNNKKLTHDEMVIGGYKHLVPHQLCLPRVYHYSLAKEIIDGLGCGEQDVLVLKLCNRSRAAGIIPVPVDELDEVLEELLVIPDDMEEWLTRKLARGSEETLEVDWGCFEEQRRHWWSNECPFFVVETYCESVPVLSEADEKLYDGTMRVAFALRRKAVKAQGRRKKDSSYYNYENPPAEEEPKEQLELEWLGGYWKLPKDDVNSDKLRERCISAARTKGTAAVRPAHLHDIYAAMGDSVQQLFSLTEPGLTGLAQKYGTETPSLAAYLTARSAVTLRDLSKCRQAMDLAAVQLAKCEDSLEKRFVESYVQRGYGVFEALQAPGHGSEAMRWEAAMERFAASILKLPSNATAWYLKGMALLELGKPAQAIEPMQRALLLDLDFKAPYVNLGVAFLRMSRLDETIEISDALLLRHPDSPQCHYHIAVAAFLKSQLLVVQAEGDGANLSEQEASEYEELRKRALQEMTLARDSEEGQRLQYRSPSMSPFLDEDDQIVNLLRPPFSIFSKTTSPSRRRIPFSVVMPVNVGWRFFGWRT